MSAADAGPAWAAWSSVTPVLSAPAARQHYISVYVPQQIAPNADGAYPDLRVIDERSNEIPFALDPDRAPSLVRHVSVIDGGFVPHEGSQVVLDLGAEHDVVDTISLDVDSTVPRTFFEHVDVDASDDRRVWRTSDESVVFRVARDGESDLAMSIQPTRSRWLRVRVRDPRAPFRIAGADIGNGTAGSSRLDDLRTASVIRNDSVRDQTWTFRFAQPVRPTAVRFVTNPLPFSRQAFVESSDDNEQTWESAGSGTISRFADGASSLSVWLTPRTARDWRVTIRNGNDRTLSGLSPRLVARTHAVVFMAEPDGKYRLLSGNAGAVAPTYDLPVKLAHSAWHADGGMTAATAPNAAYRDPRPIGERFPWLVSAALVTAALALGGIAVRTIRAVGTT